MEAPRRYIEGILIAVIAGVIVLAIQQSISNSAGSEKPIALEENPKRDTSDSPQINSALTREADVPRDTTAKANGRIFEENSIEQGSKQSKSLRQQPSASTTAEIPTHGTETYNTDLTRKMCFHNRTGTHLSRHIVQGVKSDTVILDTSLRNGDSVCIGELTTGTYQFYSYFGDGKCTVSKILNFVANGTSDTHIILDGRYVSKYK